MILLIHKILNFMVNILSKIPVKIRDNALSQILNSFLSQYKQLSRRGRIFGLALVDQDAKVLAVNSFFHNSLNFWDIGAIGAALHGVGKQGRDFFHAKTIHRASLIFQEKQFFVHMIGAINFPSQKSRELLLISIGSNLNIGLIIMMMKKNAEKIKNIVRQDQISQSTLKMSEDEFQKHIYTLRKEMFNIG